MRGTLDQNCVCTVCAREYSSQDEDITPGGICPSDDCPSREMGSRTTARAGALAALPGAVQSLMHQVNQMRGMFDDEDGSIQAALEDGEAALANLDSLPDTILAEAAPAMRSALAKIGEIIESPCDPLSVIRKINRIQAAACALIGGQNQQPKPGTFTFCPYCGSSDTEAATDAFLEMGEYLGKNHESEGGADGRRCMDCQGEFWINGPEMPETKRDTNSTEDAA